MQGKIKNCYSFDEPATRAQGAIDLGSIEFYPDRTNSKLVEIEQSAVSNSGKIIACPKIKIITPKNAAEFPPLEAIDVDREWGLDCEYLRIGGRYACEVEPGSGI